MRSQEQLDQSPTKKQSSAASPTLARPSQGEEAFASVTLETDEAILAEGRRIVFLCCFVGVISSLDRQAMSVAIVPMSKAMGYSDTIKGSISSVFSFGYTLALVPLGLAQQFVSARLIMAGGVIVWSSFTLLTPFFAHEGVPQLLAVRMVVGAAEAVTGQG